MPPPHALSPSGSVGSHLQESFDAVNTYFSRDAGVTWEEVAKGSHIYEFGDHGSLIVMAPDTTQTDKVMYAARSKGKDKSMKESEVKEVGT